MRWMGWAVMIWHVTVPSPGLAQDADVIAAAEASGACGPFGVASAAVDVEGRIRVICNEDATAFVPLLGGLAPALGLGAAATVLSALAGGNSTPDTR